MSELEIIAGTATSLGIISLVFYYAFLNSTNAKVPHYNKEIIDSLKNKNFPISSLSSLSLAKVKALLENDLEINREIINNGISFEISLKAKVARFFGIAFILAGIILFIIDHSTISNTITFGGSVIDEFSKKPIADAKIEIDGRPDILPILTDSKGYFQFNINPATIKIAISHENYTDKKSTITITTNNSFITFPMETKLKYYTRTLSGNVITQNKNYAFLKNVKISVIGDSVISYSNSNGYFNIVFKQKIGQESRIIATKYGYYGYDHYILDSESNLTILLEKK